MEVCLCSRRGGFLPLGKFSCAVWFGVLPLSGALLSVLVSHSLFVSAKQWGSQLEFLRPKKHYRQKKRIRGSEEGKRTRKIQKCRGGGAGRGVNVCFSQFKNLPANLASGPENINAACTIRSMCTVHYTKADFDWRRA